MTYNVAKMEIEQLDLDLIEIYNDYGTKKLELLKYFEGSAEVDDVYMDYTSEPSYIPYLVEGLIRIDTKPDNFGELGNQDNKCTYNVKILKSSLDKQGVTNIYTKDKLRYKGLELNIQNVKPQPILGDYFLQYSVQAIGDLLELGDEDE